VINGIDWSQFIPDLIVGLLLLFVASAGAIIAYFKSERFREWLKQMRNRLGIGLMWLSGKWRLIVLYSFVMILGALIFRVYSDWKVVAFSLTCYALGFLSWRLFNYHPILASRNKPTEIKIKYSPISLSTGIGNSYLKNRYIDPPSGDVILGGAQFLLKPDSLIFDTNEQIRYYLPRNDGGKEVDLRLPEPAIQVKSVHLLINSGNSKNIYANEVIGKIRLIFKDAPPIVVELVLGQNIREWCPGNSGGYVRETSSPSTKNVWMGMSKNGANAVIDCLKIPVYECMRNCSLEKIIFVYKPTQKPSDTMGVHFSVFAVSLEIERHM